MSDAYFYAPIMISDNEIIRLIFGFKVKFLRQQKSYSYQELSDHTGLSVSYLNDIEKGKRYPKPDKINALANALGVDYNYMVATNASKRLQPIIDLISSKFFKYFPLEEFGLKPEKLIELFTNTPDKVTSFISTVLKLARNYQVDEEQFFKEALRSYQDMHNNYFPELETAVTEFRSTYKVKGTIPYTSGFLQKKLKEFGIEVDDQMMSQKSELKQIRSFFDPAKKILHIQNNLSRARFNFLLARELGFQYLALKERPNETPILEINSFEKLLNNYKASHFAAALLMDEQKLVEDIKKLARENTWSPKLISSLLSAYDVTPETLMQRLTHILPHHFGIDDLFFLRLTGDQNLTQYKMTKDLHLSKLHSPYNNELNENYCQRWVSITAIKELRLKKSAEVNIDAQISKYWNTDNQYLCISAATPSHRDPSQSVSVTLGLLINEKLKSTFYFISDPKLKVREVHTTCERCGIVDCEARLSPPLFLEKELIKKEVLDSLEELGGE